MELPARTKPARAFAFHLTARPIERRASFSNAAVYLAHRGVLRRILRHCFVLGSLRRSAAFRRVSAACSSRFHTVTARVAVLRSLTMPSRPARSRATSFVASAIVGFLSFVVVVCIVSPFVFVSIVNALSLACHQTESSS
jgi:hypothetical protein